MKNRKKYLTWTIVLNAIVFLIFFNRMVFMKERTLSEGRLVFLALAPVDPRSLMQGDYMRLRYEITDNVSVAHIPKRGYCQVALDERNIGKRVIVTTKDRGAEDSDREIWIRYFYNGHRLQLGAESYFFQEGEASKYDSAAYGALRVDDQGYTVLFGLYDRHLKRIE